MSGESDKPADQVRNLRDQVKSIERDDAAERAEASAAISETIDQVAATAEDAAQQVIDKYQTAAESIRAHPFASVLGAAAVGFILGRALR
jgi:ElaB/YqjD/DUF883 family membrane-anchored ribosome-binding protein